MNSYEKQHLGALHHANHGDYYLHLIGVQKLYRILLRQIASSFFKTSAIILMNMKAWFRLLFVVYQPPTSHTAHNGFLVKEEFAIISFHLYPLVVWAGCLTF